VISKTALPCLLCYGRGAEGQRGRGAEGKRNKNVLIIDEQKHNNSERAENCSAFELNWVRIIK